MKRPDQWDISDMLNYALQRYNLSDSYNHDFTGENKNYERQIRRTLEKNNLVKKENGQTHYEYIVSSKIGKYVIDEILHDYFAKRENGDVSIRAFAKQDNLRNEQYETAFSKYDEEYIENLPTEEDINKSIDRFMLRALFDLFFDFDENSYKQDFIKRASLIDYDDIRFPYKEGYSQIDYRLNHPIDSYCKKKTSE